LSEDYPGRVQGVVEELSDNYRRCYYTPELRNKKITAIYDITLDMKGQGGTFSYPLITDFGASFFEYTRKLEECSDKLVALIKAHVDGMKAVISGRVSRDRGKMNKGLLEFRNLAIKGSLAEGSSKP
jgi:hypothetical protein